MTKLSLCTSAQHSITGCHYTVILSSYQNSAVTLKLQQNITVAVHLVTLCGGLKQVLFFHTTSCLSCEQLTKVIKQTNLAVNMPHSLCQQSKACWDVSETP
jgi:hypothetical protein